VAYEKTIHQFAKMLKNLNAILDKAGVAAEAKKYDVEVLLQSRLAPDQFTFVRQVQIACDTAKMAAARLAGKEAPSHPDTEKTLPELKARVESVAKYLGTFTAKDFSEAPARHITQPRWNGEYITGEEYLYQHAIPNLYFHITTAYAILRHNGVEIGKKDYLGAMPFKK
jgi:uncharacterized protein